MATRSMTASDKVFVRGPDGAVYILSKDKPPYKLNDEEVETVGRILDDAEKQVGEQLKAQLPGFGSMVNVHVHPFHH